MGESMGLNTACRPSRESYAIMGVFTFFLNSLMLTVPLLLLQIDDRLLGGNNAQLVQGILADDTIVFNGGVWAARIGDRIFY